MIIQKIIKTIERREHNGIKYVFFDANEIACRNNCQLICIIKRKREWVVKLWEISGGGMEGEVGEWDGGGKGRGRRGVATWRSHSSYLIT